MLIETIPVGPMATNCYIYSPDGVHAAVIDPAAEPQRIVGHMKALELKPVAIINTHGHFDHTGGNAALKVLFGAPIYIGAGDAFLLGPNAELIHRQGALLLGPEAVSIFQQYYVPSPPADFLLKEGQEVPETGLRVLETPGHSPGGITLVGNDFAFCGDVIFAGAIGRADLPGADEDLLMSSLRTRILTLPGRTKLYPGHGPPTTVATEKANNPFLV